MWPDLRLLKLAMREAPVADVIEQLEPWAIGGFVVMFVSGILLSPSSGKKKVNPGHPPSFGTRVGEDRTMSRILGPSQRKNSAGPLGEV